MWAAGLFSGHSALWLFLISQLFLPFPVLADLKQINSFLVAFRSVYLQKGSTAWTFDVGCARLNEFTTCCLKISSILCSLAWFSCSLTLAAIQMFPQSFNPFHKYTVRSKAVCFQMNSLVRISVLSLRIHSINSSILDLAVTSSSAVFPTIAHGAETVI